MSPAPPSTSSPINLLAIIPARKGSRRIPGKNGRPLGGKPLVLWTIEAAAGCSRLDRILLSTDGPEIASLGRDAGVEGLFMRPSSLRTDGAQQVDVVRRAADFV